MCFNYLCVCAASLFDNFSKHLVFFFRWFKGTINCVFVYSSLSLYNMIREDANSHETWFFSSHFVISFRYTNVCVWSWWWCCVDEGQKGKNPESSLTAPNRLGCVCESVLHLYSTKICWKKVDVCVGRRLLFTLQQQLLLGWYFFQPLAICLPFVAAGCCTGGLQIVRTRTISLAHFCCC